MTIYQELADLVTRLPAVDGPDERRALVAFTGPAEMGIYLDWQGSNVAFAGRLLAELSRRGKAALADFVTALPHTPQVQNSVERRQALADLGARLDALDDAAFRAEFPVPAAPHGAGAAAPLDPAMLSAALVYEVLAPYYGLGAEGLRREAGESALALAEGLARQVDAGMAADPAAGALLALFRQDPVLGQAGLLAILKARLGADETLARQMAATLDAAAQSGEGGLRSLVRLGRQAGPLGDDLASIVAGPEVVKGIWQKVEQQVETVGAGGTVVGTVTGGSAPVTIGGQHHHGDRIDVGGAYFAGSVQAGHDIVGGDQVVHGDQVGGDRFTIGGDAHFGPGPGAQGAGPQPTFQDVLDCIARRPPDPDVDTDEIRETVGRVKDEIARGDAANPAKVERWLRQLLEVAPDVGDLTLKWLANPATGAATAVLAVAGRLQTRAE